jgi:Ser/Thr protein kinase RdoA (MazF antagonist)
VNHRGAVSIFETALRPSEITCSRGDTLESCCEGSIISEDTSKAHGLLGQSEAPDWPHLTLAEADRILRQYPLADGAVELLSFSPRPFSAASVVATPQGKVFVKRHHRTVRGSEGLLEEHRFLNYLAESMASRTQLVQSPLLNSDQESVTLDGDWTYEVHPIARGLDLYQDALSWTPFRTPGHAHSAGRAMGWLHRAAQDYDAPPRRAHQLVSSFTIFAADGTKSTPAKQMEAYLEDRPLLREYAEQRNWRQPFNELFLPLHEKLKPYLGSLKPMWTHNDFHASNLAWSNDSFSPEVTGIIDFGLADRTNAVHDLATAIERNIIEWLRLKELGNTQSDSEILHLNHLDTMLSGYEAVSPLSDEEAHALPAMLPLAHCEFALSETDYFLSILHSSEKAYLAYEGYFLSHAKWFESAQGRVLLDHLERWADSRSRNSEAHAR